MAEKGKSLCALTGICPHWLTLAGSGRPAWETPLDKTPRGGGLEDWTQGHMSHRGAPVSRMHPQPEPWTTQRRPLMDSAPHLPRWPAQSCRHPRDRGQHSDCMGLRPSWVLSQGSSSPAWQEGCEHGLGWDAWPCPQRAEGCSFGRSVPSSKVYPEPCTGTRKGCKLAPQPPLLHPRASWGGRG